MSLIPNSVISTSAEKVQEQGNHYFTSRKLEPDFLIAYLYLYRTIRHQHLYFCSSYSIFLQNSSFTPVSVSMCFITIKQLLLLPKMYDWVSKSFRTGRLERELQTIQLCATRCSCIAILWVSLVSFVAITLCVASQRVFIVVHFVIDSVRKLLDKSSYTNVNMRK
jgi:hypothetical protein